MGGVAAAAGPTTKSQALHRGKVGIRWVSLALQFWPSSVNDHSLWDKGKGENGREQVVCDSSLCDVMQGSDSFGSAGAQFHQSR